MSRNEERKRFRSARNNRTEPRRASDEPSSEGSAAGRGSQVKLYGLQPVIEALRARTRPIEYITIADAAHDHRMRELHSLASTAGVPVRRVPRETLARLVGPEANHQGVIATIGAARYLDGFDLLTALGERVGTAEPPLAVVLDGVEDPRNLGAVLRTVECVGGHGVFIPERRSVGLTDTVAKAAAGALEHVPVARVTNLSRLVEEMKERNIWTVATSADAHSNYAEWDWTGPCAVFFGAPRFCSAH